METMCEISCALAMRLISDERGDVIETRKYIRYA
jgi:hypothetical protein